MDFGEWSDYSSLIPDWSGCAKCGICSVVAGLTTRSVVEMRRGE